jgi:hypothetical protein
VAHACNSSYLEGETERVTDGSQQGQIVCETPSQLTAGHSGLSFEAIWEAEIGRISVPG